MLQAPGDFSTPCTCFPARFCLVGSPVCRQAPALIFRPGTVDEADVLSLHGKPRSQHPEAKSPAKYGRAPPPRSTIDRLALADGADHPQSRRRVGGGGTERAAGPKARHPKGGGGGGFEGVFDDDDDDDEEEDDEDDGTAAAQDRGGGGGGGGEWIGRGSGGGQPLLLSLADLTTAGLQKLLQAAGGSKMFFDPDSQRWVGEEVDLSGFEDPNTSSKGSASPAGANFAAAAVAAVGGEARSSSTHRSTSRSPGRIGSPSPRFAHGARSPLIGGHRRWSSSGGEGYPSYSSRHPSAAAAAFEGSSSKRKPAVIRKPSHVRRHSLSVATASGGGGGGGGGVLEGSGDRGGCRSSRTCLSRPSSAGGSRSATKSKPSSRRCKSLSKHGSSMVSSGASSVSDTGSVVRLWDDHRDGGTRRQSPGATLRPAREAAEGAEPAATAAADRAFGRSDMVVGVDQLSKSRLSHVFETAAHGGSSEDAGARRGSPPTSQHRRGVSSPVRGADSLEPWPWGAAQPGSPSPLGLENSLASGSDVEASDTSDWDQVCVLCVFL